MDTLPDYLAPGLDIVSIGLNPSLPSARAGFYFANPRNRFWRALNASGLVPEALEPGREAHGRLLNEYGIGFTDVAKRPSAGGGELRAADFRAQCPALRERLLRYRPLIAWFHGKQAWRHYLRYGEGVRGDTDLPWGEQSVEIDGIRVFVTPNPSPANATYSLDDLIDWYAALARLRDRLR